MNMLVASFPILAVVPLLAGVVQAQMRLPTVPPDQYTEAQKKAADAFLAVRKTPVFGPFEPMIHSPEVMSQVRAMGDYLRYKSVLGNRLSELAILITAGEWSQDYEWGLHRPIAEGRRPGGMNPDQEIVYDFSSELHKNKGVSVATFARAEARFGKQGIVDMTGINGYYTFLAMQLNVVRYPGPSGAQRLPHLPQ